ncbi:MAG: mRNA interferase HigB [bacterium ADurb.Bin374]|nr:MAG: mRNA interferase HigB [bacterium ADurb.Bin374]
MHIISQKKLRDFWTIQPKAELDLRKWYAFVRRCHWRNSADIKAVFATASFFRGNRVVFNIGGNNFRLVVKMVYQSFRVYVRFVGTHAEYDRIDAETI